MSGLRERQKRARRQAILEAAGSLFREQGYAQTTVEAIAARAGLSPATVFNYYPSKGDLLLALVAEADARYLARLRRRRAAAGLPPECAVARLLASITAESLKVLARDAWRHLLASTLLHPEAPFVRAYAELNARLLDTLTELIASLQAQGALRAEADPARLARVLFDLDQALFERLVTDPAMGLKDYRAELEAAVGLVMRGVMNRES